MLVGTKGLRRDCARLRDRKMPWIILLNICLITHTLTIKKIEGTKLVPRISKISRFFTSRAVCTRLRGHRRGKSVNMSGRGSQDFMISQSHAICPQSKKSWYLWYWCLWFFLSVKVSVLWQIFQLQFMINKRWPDVLALSTTFNDLSVSRNLFSKVKWRQFGASGNERIWDFREPPG